MTKSIAIATADKSLFEAVRPYLTKAIDGCTDDAIESDPLPHAEAARDWLDSRDRTLLLVDGSLPPTAGAREDRGRGMGARELLQATRDSGIETPILVIMQSFLPELEARCTPANHAIALPLDQLFSHRAAVLKPFLAMLMGPLDKTTNAIPGTFRVIEVDFCKDRSICWLGYDDKTTLLKWNSTTQLSFVRRAARVFSDMEIYSRRGWIEHVRTNGEAVFLTHVMEAIGTGLFTHIEKAAGGLEELSFRYAITDPDLYAAPFEGSVRVREDDQDGAFVLLSAPVVRRLSAPALIRVSPHRSAELPQTVRALFIRSQMSEHPDGKTKEDQLTISFRAGGAPPVEKTFSFAKLASIDVELKAMQDLAEELGPGRMKLDLLDLSGPQDAKAGDLLRSRLSSEKYNLVHYAGHAWSSGFDGRETNLLVLPGREFGKASGFPIEEFAQSTAAAEAHFVYFSACRGSSTRIMVPNTFVVSERPAAAKRSTVIPPANPLLVKSKTTPPANRRGGRLSAREIEPGAKRF